VPIHDQGYRRYGGQKTRTGTNWLVITRTGIRTFITRRVFLALVLAAWARFIVEAIRIYLTSNVPQIAALPQASMFATTTTTFHDMVDSWFVNLVAFVITVYVGAGLIANDRRANALQIYLSKPLTRAEYVFGKLAILMTFLLAVTWLPAMALLMVQTAFSGSMAFVAHNLSLLPAITLFSFVQAITLASAMLALSSLSNSARYVGILYTSVVFFTQAVYGVLSAVTRSTVHSWISLGANLTQIGNLIFRLPLKYETPWPLSLFMIVGLIGLSALILERRVRGVEVVS
jgi:ABC-2 type transport system permease protein